jgi:hypothetical protein
MNVPANCVMMALGASVMRRVISAQARANRKPAIRLPNSASATGRHELAHLHVLGGNQADRDAVDQQCAGIVEQAFALEDLLDAVGQVDLAQDRGGRRGVGRRHDGAERDRDRPWHVRAKPVRDDCDGGGRDPDRDQHQRRDRQPVVAKVAQRGVESRIQQHRRHEQRQCQLRLQRPRRTAWHEGQQHAADREEMSDRAR